MFWEFYPKLTGDWAKDYLTINKKQESMLRDKTHVMVDIETMGNRHNAPIISIGAIQFDLDGNTFERFEKVITLDSSMAIGCEPDASTIIWWMKQSYDARQYVTNKENSVTINKALHEFNTWLKSVQPKKTNLYLWANSPSFDLSLLKNSYQRCNIKPYWLFYKELDVRTIQSFFPEVKKEAKEDAVGDVLHTPIADCELQIKYLTSVLNLLMP